MPAITLLFGGRSVENRSSCRMYEHLRELLSEQCPEDLEIVNVIGITPTGKFRASGPQSHRDMPSATELLSRGREMSVADFLEALQEGCDFIFSLLQGQEGEDGTLQGLARFFDFPDNFGSTLTSGVTFDKYAQSCVAQSLAADFLTPIPTVLVPSGNPVAGVVEAIQLFGNRPVLMKPNAAGGVFKVLRLDLLVEEEIERYASDIAPFDDHFLIQERIEGVELVVGMIYQAGQRQMLPVFEVRAPMVPKGAQQSWLSTGGGYVRRLDDADPQATRALHAAGAISRCLRDETYCSFDFIAGRDGSLHFLEIGTRPALSKSSIFPRLLEARGMSLLDLIRLEYENHAASRAFRRQRQVRIAEWVCANA